ncbi:MAG: arylesterase [Opitutales bacterium]|nr:arylesterase [Opitutales bacterium]MCH8541326.1 arylesterase [Opitutales bacterium]
MTTFHRIFLLASLLSLGSAAFGFSAEHRIIFFGDSLTAGFGLDESQAYPALIANSLREEGWQGEAVNAGLSGEATSGGLSRVDWILRGEVDVFVLALGANDALGGHPVQETKKNLIGIIEKVRQARPETEIVLVGMKAPPNLGRNFRDAFDPIFPEVAEKMEVTFIPFLLEGVAGERDLNLPDGIHPNAEGQKILAENVYPTIHRLVFGKKPTK